MPISHPGAPLLALQSWDRRAGRGLGIAEAGEAESAASLLGPRERERVLRMAPRRRRDFLLGRLAARRALAAGLAAAADRAGAALPVEVESGDGRPPRLVWSGAPTDLVAAALADLNLSLSHGGGVAAAWVARTPRDGWVGIDVEQVRRRDPAVARIFCSSGELAWAARLEEAERDVWLTSLWALKEAVFKALAHGGASDVRHARLGRPGCVERPCSLVLSGDSLEAWRRLGEGPLRVRSRLVRPGVVMAQAAVGRGAAAA